MAKHHTHTQEHTSKWSSLKQYLKFSTNNGSTSLFLKAKILTKNHLAHAYVQLRQNERQKYNFLYFLEFAARILVVKIVMH